MRYVWMNVWGLRTANLDDYEDRDTLIFSFL